ncbi:Do family serine endopeptidase [Kordia algicida OT-1]|uniref:Serine protease n=1 Tax=Kordia algicida OT-1 TaxID=391587 RepID=A9EDU9_9FLAO|nr:Do family serine endopeptidase [Kordia algicida]EDP94179.1 serine protease [Kordia algicida OT-1]
MKKSVFISAIISLVISFGVIGGYHYFGKQEVAIKHINAARAHKVLYAANAEGEITPLDFTKTTEKVLDAVVHISAKKMMPAGSNQMFQYRELPDPFREFFGQSPFGQFFGEKYHNNLPQQPYNSEKKQMLKEMPIVGTGSGVIVNEKGYILTNNHVIDNADEIEVTLHNNDTYKATIVGTDPSTDLALLQIKKDNLKALSFVNSDDVEVGEWVLAVGNPFSLNSTVTAGIVSAKARNINVNQDKFAVESFIQTDAAINPGNSGGALVNLNGDLIGINTAIATRTGTYNGYGFAVPSNIVSKVVEDLLKYGAVQRGMLGVNITTLNSKLAKEKDIDLTQGVFIASVNDGSAADKAGLKNGDVIVKVDDRDVKTSPELQELIALKRPGDAVTLLVNRKGKEKEYKVTLQNRIGSTKLKKKEHAKILNLLGAELEALDENEAEKLGINSGVKVTTLYAGKLKKFTQLREGFIITHIDGQRIKNVEDVMNALKDKKGGVMLEGIYEDMPGKYYYAIGLNS